MSRFKYEVNGKSYYEVYVSFKSLKNRAQRRQKGIKTEVEAKSIEKKLKDECIEEVKGKDGLGEKWFQICAQYKLFNQEFSDLQQNTIDDYDAMLRIWTSNFANKSISEITRSDVRLAIVNAKSSGKSNSYLNKILHTIGRVHIWAQREGLCPNSSISITHGIKISKVEEKPPLILSAPELKRLFQKAKETKNPWYSVWQFAFLTGMRSGELYALKWNKINLEEKTILVHVSYERKTDGFKSTKNKKFRSIPINDDLLHLLNELKKEPCSEFVLPRINRWKIGHQAKSVHEICSEAGLPRVNFHTFRSCFATQLLSRGISLAHVMKICGWAELKTVQKYLRLTGIEERGMTNCLNNISSNDCEDKTLKMHLGLSEKSTLIYSVF